MKKAFSVIIVIAILTIVGLIVYKNVDTSSLKGKEKITVTGYYGSEKEDFFKDQRVLKILKNKYGISLDLLKSGSMDMVELDLNKVDVVWPSSEIPVDQIKSKYGSKIRKSVSVGYSPMIVTTWAPIKDLLQQNGLIKQENGINFIDIQKLIKLTLDNKKWNELNGSDKYYNSRKTVLIKTTDPNSQIQDYCIWHYHHI